MNPLSTAVDQAHDQDPESSQSLSPNTSQNLPQTLRPARSVQGASRYRVPKHPAPIDLKLDSNEGSAPSSLPELSSLLEVSPLNRYPSKQRLTEALADDHGVSPSRVLVTAGGDDALDRACRAFLEPGRSMVYPRPSFEMIPRFVTWAQGELIEVDWRGEFPLAEVRSSIQDHTTLIAVVSPNNPTGAVVTRDELTALSEAAPSALILLDHAYVEFVDDPALDLTAYALSLPNVCVFRTFSKAWGIAGARVGYVMGPEIVIEWLARVGNPYSVAAPSLALALNRLTRDQEEVSRSIEQVKRERSELTALLTQRGVEVTPSQGNFVYLQTPRARWIRDALAGLGIGVRAWPDHPELGQSLRVTCPSDAEQQARLLQSLETALRPEALLFDLDGVIADVSESYRATIIATCETYGVSVTLEDIAEIKGEGDANNDWVVSQRLLSRRGVEAPLDEVTRRFELIYQGPKLESTTLESTEHHTTRSGLYLREQMIPTLEQMTALCERLPAAIVTGRPRRDAEMFLGRFGLTHLFSAVVTMEDARLKPDPEPVQLALSQLGVERAWMIGDTVDDIRAARGAAVVPLGVLAPAEPSPDLARDQLLSAGAARVLTQLDDLLELLS